MMEWFQAAELVAPHVVQIMTPRGSGSGFSVSASETTDICAIATAAHVVQAAHLWEEPIRLFHASSGKWRALRAGERVIIADYAKDSAAIVFERGSFPIPRKPMELTPEGRCWKVGKEVGWLGFPAMVGNTLCFFSGSVSAWRDEEKRYLIDGVIIHGVSGGPTIAFSGESEVMVAGVVSGYWPNLATGQTLPGLGVVVDVTHFQEVAKHFKTLDEVARQQQTPRPPEGGGSPVAAG